jgi:hypothetical protein
VWPAAQSGTTCTPTLAPSVFSLATPSNPSGPCL